MGHFEISIILPVYNRAKLVERTLDSIANQTYRPLHLIIVDNNSTDDSLKIIQKWSDAHQSPDFKIDVVTELKTGAPAARNKGLSIVEEEWTMFFDSDDLMSPNHVAKAMKCANEAKDADIIGWDVNMRLLDGKSVVKRFESSDLLFHGIMHGCMATQCYMARTSIFRRAGQWNEDVEVWNDIELATRLLSLPVEHRGTHGRLLTGINVYKINGKPTVEVICQQDSITGINYSAKGKERAYAIDCIEASLRPELKWIANLKRAILAGNFRKEGEEAMAQDLMLQVKDASRWHRLLYNFAFRHTGKGRRGAARIVRNFF